MDRPNILFVVFDDLNTWIEPLGEDPADFDAVHLFATADNTMDIWINGRFLQHNRFWREISRATIADSLRAGENLIAVSASNNSGPANAAGFLARLDFLHEGKTIRSLFSDASWRAHQNPEPDWNQPGFDDSGWAFSATIAPYGEGPWGNWLERRIPVQRHPPFTSWADKPAP